MAALATTAVGEERSEILNNIGVTYSRQTRVREAAEYYEVSVREAPNRIAILNYAKALLSSDNALSAAAWLKNWEALRGDSFDWGWTLSVALFRARLFADAAAEMEHIRHDAPPDKVVGVTALLIATYADGLHDFARAIDIGTEAIKTHSDAPVLYNNLAYALLLSGLTRSAADILAQVDPAAFEEGDSAVALRATTGLLLLSQGDIEAGTRMYERALAAADSETLRERVKVKRDLEVARALIRADRFDEAARLLERAAAGSDDAYPYQLEAKDELRRLGGDDLRKLLGP